MAARQTKSAIDSRRCDLKSRSKSFRYRLYRTPRIKSKKEKGSSELRTAAEYGGEWRDGRGHDVIVGTTRVEVKQLNDHHCLIVKSDSDGSKFHAQRKLWQLANMMSGYSSLLHRSNLLSEKAEKGHFTAYHLRNLADDLYSMGFDWMGECVEEVMTDLAPGNVISSHYLVVVHPSLRDYHGVIRKSDYNSFLAFSGVGNRGVGYVLRHDLRRLGLPQDA